MKEYKFSRNRGQVKYCPCGKSNSNGKFAPFQGYLKEGYCHSCDQAFYPDSKTITKPFDRLLMPKQQPKFHDLELVEKTVLVPDDQNNFIIFLKTLFTSREVQKAVLNYLIGSWSDWKGITVFWQIDQKERVYHGKLMLFNTETGKRVVGKDGNAIISSVRSRLNIDKIGFNQCLFGLHLVGKNTKVIALIESEKSAIIMSIFKPEYVWLSTGGKGGFKFDFLNPIKGQTIIAFPDKGVYDLWLEKANQLNSFGFNIRVSNWLETQNEFNVGTDLADVYMFLRHKGL